MDGDEKIRLGIVGYLRTTVKGNEDIAFARVDHLYVGTVIPDQLAQLQGHFQDDVLLFRDFTEGTGIVSSVSGIDDDDKLSRLDIACPPEGGKEHCQAYTYYI